jgi:hypothetical protein
MGLPSNGLTFDVLEIWVGLINKSFLLYFTVLICPRISPLGFFSV